MKNVDKNISRCLNCNNPFSEHDLYCSNCSQKRTNGKITVKDLFADFFSTVFNVDGKLFNTIKDLFIPGKLTAAFFAGQHQKYYKPLRIFFVLLVAHLAILSLTVLNSNNLDTGDAKSIYTELQYKHELKKEWEPLLIKYRQQFTRKNETVVIDTIAATLNSKIFNTKDSIYLQDVGSEDGGFTMNLDFGDHRIAVKDLYLLENNFDEFAKKYEVTSFMHKLGLQQTYKISSDPKGTFQFVLGNMTWMLILLLPVIALVLKLLYVRRDYYFVQHLTFLFHLHAFAFLFASIMAILMHFINNETFNIYIGIGTLVVLLVYPFVALKRYYGQSFFKTILKYLVVVNSYLFMSLIFFLFTILISFALYT